MLKLVLQVLLLLLGLSLLLLLLLSIIAISNGNRTEWSTIHAQIRAANDQSDSRILI